MKKDEVRSPSDERLGLKENRQQFILLVIVNAFVGGMIGLERTILPTLASDEFQIESSFAMLSFIIAFGVSKAAMNYFTGRLAGIFGRRNLLIVGWLFAIPVPLLLMWAPSWNWILLANVFLGINQGLAWSSTVVMKIDLVGEKQRGLAMGINEFAGYLAVAAVALFTGWIAAEYGTRPYPFLIGIVLTGLGLFFSIFFIKDTQQHVNVESSTSTIPRLKKIFVQTTFREPTLSAITQAGLVNNLNDAMVWGLLPVILYQRGFNLLDVGIITSIYPAVWGLGQLLTGKMADHYSKKNLLIIGMVMQGIVLMALPLAETFFQFIALNVHLGLGTAIVYPTFLAAIADHTHPLDRAGSLGVFRMWRDFGYVVGAVLTGILAQLFGVDNPIFTIGFITLFSGILVLIRYKK